jgi:hypothetical protein
MSPFRALSISMTALSSGRNFRTKSTPRSRTRVSMSASDRVEDFRSFECAESARLQRRELLNLFPLGWLVGLDLVAVDKGNVGDRSGSV